MASSGEELLRPTFTSDEECTAFMKGGGCSVAYEAFAECVAAACWMGLDDMELCREAALNLKKCMDENADHYAPLLRSLPPNAGEGKKDG